MPGIALGRGGGGGKATKLWIGNDKTKSSVNQTKRRPCKKRKFPPFVIVNRDFGEKGVVSTPAKTHFQGK